MNGQTGLVTVPVSADAAGIIVTSFVIDRLSCGCTTTAVMRTDSPVQDARCAVVEPHKIHPECNAIYAALD
ncbi:antirestriction protein [Escherichia coli]